ncbi:MAG: sulfatase-like hydrolase/transferase [Oscillospiraceae bacterium]|nr:sulfatase-like hydrolase/transferase [Oscillospiraceae bacterium]
MIVADQHRADALGCRGRFDVRTPNLDRLAARGTYFENAFTPLPVCTPARQSMLTGLNPDSYGAFWNPGFFAAADPPKNDYWPEMLRRAGMKTVFLGKWGASAKTGPTDWGYETYIPYGDWARMVREKYPDLKGHGWFGGTSGLPLADSKTHWLAARAAEQIEALAGRPWHIRVDYTDPHLPCEPSEPFASMYDPAETELWDGCADTLEGKPYIQKQQVVSWWLENMTADDWREPVARYRGMVSQIDDSVGIILDALERTGQTEDTVVMYLSDHGDTCGSHGMLDKHYILYDDVVRVPFLAAGPGIAAGRRKELVSIGFDLAPTLDELFGIRSPKAVGRSMAPLLRGERVPDWRTGINASSNGQQFGFFNQRMLRDSRYKYIWNMTDVDEFYDTLEDPGETRNLIRAPEHAERIAAMRRELLALLREQGDLFLKGGWLDRQLEEGRKI